MNDKQLAQLTLRIQNGSNWRGLRTTFDAALEAAIQDRWSGDVYHKPEDGCKRVE